jgi:CSLREA domain-containing protein
MSTSALGRTWAMVLMVLVMLALAAPAAWATELTATNPNDAPDAITTDGVCGSDSEAEGNQCTLRAAIQEANIQGADDVINVPAGTYTLKIYTLKIAGAAEDASATGDLDITRALTIKGAGTISTTVAGGAELGDRIFQNHGGASTSISGLTITGGSTEGPLDGLNDGGDIRNTGTLKVSNSTITGNTAEYGGGLYNEFGTLTVERSTLNGNTASWSGGGIDSWTTENLITEKTTIANSTISANSATGYGGGVYNGLGLTEIEYSTITNNGAPTDQGSDVTSVDNGSNPANTTVFSSIISGNKNTDVVDYIGENGINAFVSEGYNLIGDGNAKAIFNKSGD